MPNDLDLTTVIEDSLLDAGESLDDAPETPDVPEPVEAPDSIEEIVPDAPEAPLAASKDEAKPEDAPKVPEVKETPVEAVPKPDYFSKKYGVPSVAFNGKENRIPYSRVKKITERAIGEIAEVALGRKLKQDEHADEVVKAHVAQIPELTTKVKAYEDRLSKVDSFEEILFKKPEEFLQMLSTVPAYAPFFKQIEEWSSKAPTTPTTQELPPDPNGDMPQPDQPLSDGTSVYSMDGLKALLAWQSAQVEARVTKQLTDRYKPIESEWQANQRIQAAMPVIQAQINEARTWPMFTENEEAIIKVLQTDNRISLEGAYQKVILPKYEEKMKTLQQDRTKIREEVLAEIRTAPRATSVATVASKVVQDPNAPRSLEDVIWEQVKSNNLK